MRAMMGSLLAVLLTLGAWWPGAAAGVTEADDAPRAAVLPSGSRVGAESARIGGADRYEVAVAISRHRYADARTARTVYLTRGDVFADALTAGTLEDGPVLLIRPGCRTVPQVVLDEIARLDPDRVVALGGEVSVCADQLAAAAHGREAGRLGGADRFEAAASIAGHGFPEGARTAYLTSGAITADALVGGSLRDGPILLASWDGRGVPTATAAAIAALDPDRVVALGGPVSVSDAALVSAAAGRSTGRIGGADRYEVARNVADRAYPSRTARVYLARGDGANFSDAVAAGMLTDGPVLLTAGPCEKVRSATAGELGQRTPSTLVALGGPATLCEPTLVGAATAARGPVDCAQTACVALTFDDGPGRLTPTVLDAFAERRVPATFYVLGRALPTYGATARRTYVQGHEIGNHTVEHPRMPDLTLAAQQDQMDRNDAALRALGIPGTRTMRPPFLAYDANTRRLGKPVVMVDTNPKDWSGFTTEEIRTFVRENVRPGSIVIQHDTVANTVPAVPGIIDDLHATGYTLVTVSELVPGMAPGDLVYNRDTVRPATTVVSMTDPVELTDGRVLPPLVDEYGVPGVAPTLTREEVLGTAP